MGVLDEPGKQAELLCLIQLLGGKLPLYLIHCPTVRMVLSELKKKRMKK